MDIILIFRRLARKVDHFIIVLGGNKILKFEDERVLFSLTLYNVTDDRRF